MKSFIEIVLYVLCLIHQSIEHTNEDLRLLLINHPTNIDRASYKLVSSNDRIKRQISSLAYPEFNPSHEQCDPHIYTKLSSCSDVNDCT